MNPTGDVKLSRRWHKLTVGLIVGDLVGRNDGVNVLVNPLTMLRPSRITKTKVTSVFNKN